MENASRALTIAGSTLLAVIIFALVVYFFQNISNVPNQQDEQLTTEQLAKFNLEYEVYDKKAMYGVDVISCLNKAKSNNEKYVEGGSFFQGQEHDYGNEYLIDVRVKINSPLQESIKVYAMTNKGEEIEQFSGYEAEGVNLKKAKFEIKGLTSFEEKTALKVANNEDKSLVVDKYYALLDKDEKLLELLKLSDTLKQTVKNTEKDAKVLETENGWSTAIWSTYLYSLKTKRFKCEEIKYSPKTGRVERITFIEI